MKDESKMTDFFEQLSTIHNYNLSTEEHFRIFGPPKDFVGTKPGEECDIFIYNIPIECEDTLLAILITFKMLYHVKFVKRKDDMKCLAFAKFMDKEMAEKSMNKMKKITIHLHHNIYTKLCASQGKELYIGNINISRYPLYMMEQILLSLAKGIKCYTVYSLDRNNRYIINLTFFNVEDLLLSVHSIGECDLFVKSPDIFVDTEAPKRMMECTPVCTLSYESTKIPNLNWPNEINISKEKYNQLKMF